MRSFWRLLGYIKPYMRRLVLAGVMLSISALLMGIVVSLIKPLVNQVILNRPPDPAGGNAVRHDTDDTGTTRTRDVGVGSRRSGDGTTPTQARRITHLNDPARRRATLTEPKAQARAPTAWVRRHYGPRLRLGFGRWRLVAHGCSVLRDRLGPALGDKPLVAPGSA